MNLSTKQRQIHKEQICGCQGRSGCGEGVGWTGSLGYMQIITFRVDTQQGPTV